MKEECMNVWDYLKKTSGLLQNVDIIKKAHKIMMGDEKGALVEEYKKSPVFLRYLIFLRPTSSRGWLMMPYIVITIAMTLPLIPF